VHVRYVNSSSHLIFACGPVWDIGRHPASSRRRNVNYSIITIALSDKVPVPACDREETQSFSVDDLHPPQAHSTRWLATTGNLSGRSGTHATAVDESDMMMMMMMMITTMMIMTMITNMIVMMMMMMMTTIMTMIIMIEG
jgi:hypothetical protein